LIETPRTDFFLEWFGKNVELALEDIKNEYPVMLYSVMIPYYEDNNEKYCVLHRCSVSDVVLGGWFEKQDKEILALIYFSFLEKEREVIETGIRKMVLVSHLFTKFYPSLVAARYFMVCCTDSRDLPEEDIINVKSDPNLKVEELAEFPWIVSENSGTLWENPLW
jgi:hypothetical protein